MAITTTLPVPDTSLLAKFAAKFSMEPQRFLATLKATAFRTDREITNEQMAALVIVADAHNLNPFLREIYAYPDKGGGIVPVVSIDGWSRIVNEHPQFDGVQFGADDENDPPKWIECAIFRKDRKHATVVREYLAECRRQTPPWNAAPRRMLRHRAFMQAARLAMGFTGLHDDDDAQRILERDVTPPPEPPKGSAIKRLNEQLRQRAPLDTDTFLSEAERGTIPTPVDTAKLDYATVRELIERAGDTDALAEAQDLIKALPSQFHGELNALALSRYENLFGGDAA